MAKRFKNVQEYLDNNGSPIATREQIKDSILRTSIDLLSECDHNFGGNAQITERASQPLFFLNEILDNVE